MAYKCDVWVWCGAVGAVMIVMAVLSLPLVQYVVKTEVHKVILKINYYLLPISNKIKFPVLQVYCRINYDACKFEL